MAEYIEREAALNRLCQENCGHDFVEGKCHNCYTGSFLTYTPAADVAPVVHGRWIPCEPDSDVRFYCSECGTEISTSWDYDCDEMWNGCPHCLARMDGDSE